MAGPFKHISAREERGVLVLAIELARISTYEQAEAMGRELIDAVEGRPEPKVVVDLSKLNYMSSVGYGPLITLRSRVRAVSGRLILCGLSGVVKEVFEATRLLINPQSPKSLFEFTETGDQAVGLLAEDK
jgi:anti-sigma B factor antagonist